MDRRKFIGTLIGCVIAMPVATEAQPARKTPVLGVLSVATITPLMTQTTIAALRQGLRDLGYIDGQNIKLELRSARGKPELLPSLAAELVQLKVNVVYAFGPAAVSAADGATRDIPIVALDLETDPVQRGWARNLAHPSGNITGLFLDLPGLTGKWLELLKETAPQSRRVALLWDSTTGPYQLAAARSAAKGLAVELQILEFRSSDDLAAALTRAVKDDSKAMAMLSSPIVRNSSEQIADFTMKNRLPAISPFRAFVDAGGLMSYGPNLEDFFRRSAAYADKILKGTKAGDLPIEQPTKFELVINLRTAKALGLTIPQPLLLRADEVIQ